MNLQIEHIDIFYNKVVVIFLVFARIFSIFYLAPMFNSQNIPAKIRVALSLLTALVVYPVVSVPESLDIDLLSITFLVLKELSVGVIIGYTGLLFVSMLRFTGELLERVMGLADANLIDPLYGEELGIIGQFQFIIFMLVFLLLNCHHHIITIISRSFDIVPIGSVIITGGLIAKMVALVGDIFVYGIKFAAPILSFLLITTVAFGIMGKSIPDMNLLILMIPAKIFIGIVGLITTTPFLIYFINYIIKEFYKDLNLILKMI